MYQTATNLCFVIVQKKHVEFFDFLSWKSYTKRNLSVSRGDDGKSVKSVWLQLS